MYLFQFLCLSSGYQSDIWTPQFSKVILKRTSNSKWLDWGLGVVQTIKDIVCLEFQSIEAQQIDFQFRNFYVGTFPLLQWHATWLVRQLVTSSPSRRNSRREKLSRRIRRREKPWWQETQDGPRHRLPGEDVIWIERSVSRWSRSSRASPPPSPRNMPGPSSTRWVIIWRGSWLGSWSRHLYFMRFALKWDL